MQTSTFETPALFGDHHVSEARKQLLSQPGVKDVYASSAFRIVEVTYDESQVSEAALREKLDALGYLADAQAVAETGVAAQRDDADATFRHSAAYDHLKDSISFQQQVNTNGRHPLNCPGIGVVYPTNN